MTNLLKTTLNKTYNQLKNFAGLNDFWNLFEIAFGTQYDHTVATNLRSQWLVGDFSSFPQIEILDSSILGNANGAYGTSTNKIYLASDFLDTATETDIIAVLLEEYGHFIDAHINQKDSAGDEGDIFSNLVRGNILSAVTLQTLKSENDHATITLDGQSIEIEQNLTPTTSSPTFVPNQVIIKLSRDISAADIKNLQTELGAKVAGTIPKLDIQLWQIATTLSVEETVKRYSQDRRVQFIEPNYNDNKLTTLLIPNDPSFPLLWGLNNTGQTGGTPNADIDAPEAWGALQDWGWFPNTGNAIVGVIDTGVDYTHPDLINNIWTNPGEIPGNNLDDDVNGYIDDVHGWDFFNNDNNPMDGHGHGTHVAGTIGAEGNNGIGVTGVNWKVKIMPIQIFSSSGAAASNFAIAQAIQYATANGADVTNNSWGGGAFSMAIYNAIQAGRLFVAAAGNNAQNNDITPFYPATYNLNNIISVEATDHNDNLAGFSNYGATTVDLAAPGVNIYSTLPVGGSLMGSNYGYSSGTSMATPHVVGAAALMVATRRDRGLPDLTPVQLRQYVLNGVDVIPGLSGTNATSGRLNLHSGVNQSGIGWGDVHMVTFDKKYYDFQASGEFIFVESEREGDDWVVQTRQKPWIYNTSVAVNTAFATLVDGNRVVFDLDFANRIQINGINATLADGQSLSIGNSIIQRSSNLYTLTYAGDDGIVDSADAQVKAFDNGNHINLEVLRFGSVHGLLGDSDGNPNNDFQLRDGTQLSPNPSWDEIHGKFADSWRVRLDENLFKTNQIPFIPNPPQFISLATLAEKNPQGVANAFATARKFGIAEGAFLNGGVLDFVVTGDEGFLKGAKQIADLALQNGDIKIPLGSIQGSKWNDVNGNGVWDEGEKALAGWKIYIDSVTNGKLDPWEISTVTNADGQYTFSNLGPGEYAILEVNQTGWIQTFPTTPYALNLKAGEKLTGINFGNYFQLPKINLGPSNQTVVEGLTTPQNASYTVTLSSASNQTISVNYATANGTATAGLDYTATIGTLTFAPGATSQVINIPILNDSLNEADETFTLTLSSPTNAVLGAVTIATTTINDTITAAVTTTLAANVENLTLTGTAAINGTGNAGNNVITGNGANNILNGGAGTDILIGGLGNDIYVVDSATDTITEGVNAGTDTIQSSVTYTIAALANIENLTLTGAAAINGTGNAGNNFITGNTGNNILNGGAGTDILTGGVGKDTLTGGLEVDRFDYRTLANSALGIFDVITDFNATTGNDLFLVTTARSGFNNVTTPVATLDATGIAARLTTAVFTANSAAQFTFGTRTFVAINDATAGFSATTDAIIEVTGLTGTLGISNFTTALV
jgi:subtilisin family serine protease/Ca2+-binding RTX toxin-like protein